MLRPDPSAVLRRTHLGMAQEIVHRRDPQEGVQEPAVGDVNLRRSHLEISVTSTDRSRNRPQPPSLHGGEPRQAFGENAPGKARSSNSSPGCMNRVRVGFFGMAMTSVNFPKPKSGRGQPFFFKSRYSTRKVPGRTSVSDVWTRISKRSRRPRALRGPRTSSSACPSPTKRHSAGRCFLSPTD